MVEKSSVVGIGAVYNAVRQEFVKRNSWWGENLRLAANAITLTTNRLWLFLRWVDHIGPRHSEIRLRYFDYLG